MSVLCFGELLLRLSPVLNGTWIKDGSMPVFVGGAELNVATALARWGLPASYCTALPDNYLSAEIVQHVQSLGISTEKVVYNGARVGTYYLPQGADLKNAGVIYDRAYSSFWELKRGVLDWDAILEGVTWFHFSAISPALNEAVAAVCREGAAAASRKGITVSVDLNYRAKLWQYGKTPDAVMPALVEHCDVVMGNIWAEEKMLGLSLPENFADAKEAYLEQSMQTSQRIQALFPKCKQVANTFRFDAGAGVRYYATLYEDGQLFTAAEQETATIIDKVGSGDTFMAGLIWGNIQQRSSQDKINFAAAAAFNKLFIKGDATNASVDEIRKGFQTYAKEETNA